VPSPTPFFDGQGRQIFVRPHGVNFMIIVEAKPGSGGAPVGTTLNPADTSQPPSLEIQVNRTLGNGSPSVDCRSGAPARDWGGIPAVNPPTTNLTQPIIDAMTDLACRFTAQPPGEPCTFGPSGEYEYLNKESSNPVASNIRQFCRNMESAEIFPGGDTIVSVRVRDTTQNPGPTKQIVVRVGTPSP